MVFFSLCHSSICFLSSFLYFARSLAATDFALATEWPVNDYAVFVPFKSAVDTLHFRFSPVLLRILLGRLVRRLKSDTQSIDGLSKLAKPDVGFTVVRTALMGFLCYIGKVFLLFRCIENDEGRLPVSFAADINDRTEEPLVNRLRKMSIDAPLFSGVRTSNSRTVTSISL